jgi:hypothetical protein
MGLKNLPVAGGREHAKAFARLGWREACDTTGKNPHIIMIKEGERATLSIPRHKKDIARALIQDLLHEAGISEKDYVAAFRKKSKRQSV